MEDGDIPQIPSIQTYDRNHLNVWTNTNLQNQGKVIEWAHWNRSKKNLFGNFENRILQKFRSSLQIDNSDNLENIWNSGKLEISFKIETHKIEVACTQLPEVQDYEFIRFQSQSI